MSMNSVRTATLEQIRAPVDEGGPVASHGVVAPGVLREDPPGMRAQIVEGGDRLRRGHGPGRHRRDGQDDDGERRSPPAQRRAVVPQGARAGSVAASPTATTTR